MIMVRNAVLKNEYGFYYFSFTCFFGKAYLGLA